MEKIVKLQYPITYKDGEVEKVVSEIKLCRLKAKHLRSLPDNLQDRGDSGKLSPSETLKILGAMTGISIEILDELDFTDLTEIFKEMQSFL